jgi:hypothetical protein
VILARPQSLVNALLLRWVLFSNRAVGGLLGMASFGEKGDAVHIKSYLLGLHVCSHDKF